METTTHTGRGGDLVSAVDPSLPQGGADYASTNNDATEVGRIGHHQVGSGEVTGRTDHLERFHSEGREHGLASGSHHDVHEHREPGHISKKNPLGVAPAPEGGMSIGGLPGLPEGHPSTMDKIVGGIDKVIATATFDKAGKETATLRMKGGKEAALGQARAPIDHI